MPLFLPFYYLCHINPQKIMEMLRYYYHPYQALTGLSNLWITDGTGQAIQHLHYLPFGEDWVDQRNTSWNAPYTFSGKEKDAETGYGYFGARYYDSGLSIWLSVDPMSDKYPSMSPYNYCANNPVMLVDPDGRDWEAYNKDGVLLATGGDANDHRQFVVMSEEDALRITDKKNVDIDNVESAVQIPDNKTINEVLDYAEKEDTKQNNREYKGWITLVNDIHRMVECIPGLPVNVCAGESGNTGSYMDLDPKYTKNDLYGAWAHFHTHYSKTCPINYIYPSQEPTKGSDELNVMRPGSIVKSSFVIMMRDKNVYLLNKNGDQGFIPFDKFRQLGK